MGLKNFFALWAALALLPAAAVAATPAAPHGRLPRAAIPSHYSLTLTVDPRTTGFHGHDEITVEITRPTRALWINGRELAVDRASVRLANGRTIAARYRQVDPSGVVLLTFASPLPAGAATLLFDYHARFNTALNGLYKVVQSKNAYAISQFEAIGARRMFPCFDEPDYKATFTLAVNAPQADVVVTNTAAVSRNQTGGGMVHWVFATTTKLATYLLSLDVGPFDVVNMGYIPPDKWRRHPLMLRGIAPKGEGRQMRYALSLTPRLVLALERYFEIGFPFAKLDMIAAPDFAAGAMENAGAITFRRRFMMMGPWASLEQRRDSLLVQAHELTHQWFGDLVTPKWWDDVWLNEAFANWMSAKVANAVMPQFEVSRQTLDGGLEAMKLDQLPSARAMHTPVNSVADIDNAFDAITYKKGAAVLAMFENYVGPEPWKRAVHAFLLKYAGGNATQDDFIATVAKLTDHPELSKAFLSYLDQSGIPDMSVVTRCSETPVLTVVQSMYAPIGLMVSDRQWQVPMCVSAAGGKDRCRVVGRTADINLGGVCPAYVMPNARGVGYYRFAFDNRGWDRLLKAMPRLDAADQITAFANMQAALGADQLSPRKFVEAIKTLAPTAHWDLIRMMAEALRQDRLSFLRPADLRTYQNFIRRTFGSRLEKNTLHNDSAPDQVLTRAALAQILVEEGQDPYTLTRLAKAARVYVASDGRNLGGLPPSLAREAMRAGVMVYGSAFGKSLVDGFLASSDDYFHRNVIYALMGSTDPNFLKGFFDLALTQRMNVGDVGYLFRYAGIEPLARVQLWDWYMAHYRPLAARISSEGMLVVPSLFDEACSSAARKQLADFFIPRLKTIPGLSRTLALTEQRIDQCISLRDSKGTSIRAALLAAGR